MQQKKNYLKAVAVAVVIVSIVPVLSWAEQAVCPFPENVEVDFKATVLATVNGPATSDQNPGNRLAYLPDAGGEITLKPDVFMNLDDFYFSAKPRMVVNSNRYRVGGRRFSNSDSKIEVIEFKGRFQMSEQLFASYGWENVQWGPSFLYSPSNPFFNDNGKKDLVNELPGKGVATLLYVHDFNWSAALLLNTDKGAFNEPDFQKTAALKLDYDGDESYFSLVLSHREHDRTMLGMYGGTTVTDALIAYAEASLEQGSNALYATPVPGILAWDMDAPKKASDAIYPVILVGMSYTLQSADTLTLEYLYYGKGYDDTDADRFFTMLDHAARFYTQGPAALSGYGHKLLGQAAENGMDYLRQHYLMLQYVNEDLIADTGLVARATVCLDDGSSRLYASLSHDLTDHMALKSSAMMNTGGGRTAFGRFLDYQIQLALEVRF